MLSKLIPIFWNLLLRSACNELKTEEELCFTSVKAVLPSLHLESECIAGFLHHLDFEAAALEQFHGSETRLWVGISLVQMQEPAEQCFVMYMLLSRGSDGQIHPVKRRHHSR